MVTIPPVSIAANLDRIRERIARAAARAGRKPEEVTLVAVSKTFPAEAIREAYAAGVRHFGENRVQEWESKQPQLADLDATWHLVGHLQSNKAARAARLFHSIDSVDSLALAQRLDRAMSELSPGFVPVVGGGHGVPVPTVGAQHSSRTQSRDAAPLQILIEVRLDPAATKSGVLESDLSGLAEAVLALPHLELRGLMGIPPFFDNPEHVRPYFRRLRDLRDSLRHHLVVVRCHSERSHAFQGRSEESLLCVLSMGMSHDFEIAIEEGASEIRLGTVLFGERVSSK